MKKLIGYYIFPLVLGLMLSSCSGSSDESSSSPDPSAPNPSPGPSPTPTPTPAQPETTSRASITYDGNSQLCGTAASDSTEYTQGQIASILGNVGSLTKYGYSFSGWNTAPDGSGTLYSSGDSMSIGSSNITLYANWTPLPSPSPKARVFILAGQSNMTGSGGTTADAPSNMRPLSGVWFDSNFAATPTNPSNWGTMGSTADYMGPEFGFASTIKNIYPLDQIVIIKVSQPATGLGSWTDSGMTNHDYLISRITTLKARLDSQVTAHEIGSYEFEGFIWMQGENEANSNILSEGLQYDQNFSLLVTEIRTLVGKPNLPTILGRISIKLDPTAGGPVKQPQLNNTRNKQVLWAQNDIKGGWVDTDDLDLVDSWHFGSFAQLILGQRFAKAWLDLADSRPRLWIQPAVGQNLATSNTEINYTATFSSPILSFSNSSVQIKGETGANTVTVTEIAPMDKTKFNIKITGMSTPGWVDIGIASTVAYTCTSANIMGLSEQTKILWTPHSGVSELLAYEPFTSTSRALHGLESTGVGWKGSGWIVQGSTTTGYETTSTAPLTYLNLATSPGYVVGGYNYKTSAIFLDRETTFKSYMTSRGNVSMVDLPGTVLWMSYLIHPLITGQSQQISLTREIVNPSISSNVTLTVKQVGGKWNLDVLGSNVDTGITVNAGQTYFMVLRLEIGGASLPSKASLWVNPTSLGGANPDPSTATSSVTVTNSNFKFSSVTWYPGSSGSPAYLTSGKFDELRIGTSYASVTPTVP